MKIVSFYSFIFVSLLLAIGCTEREFEPESEIVTPIEQIETLKKAGHLLTKGEQDQAFDLFLEVVEKEPNNIDANVGLAGIYLARDSLTEALTAATNAYKHADQDYTASFDQNINKKTIHLVLAQIYFYKGEFSRSNDQVGQILERGSVNLNPEKLAEEIERLARKI